MNGVKLQGLVKSFDGFTVLLVRDGFSQLVYKHAISTIMPAGTLKLYEGAGGAHTDQGHKHTRLTARDRDEAGGGGTIP